MSFFKNAKLYNVPVIFIGLYLNIKKIEEIHKIAKKIVFQGLFEVFERSFEKKQVIAMFLYRFDF